ncbi:TPA: hypothetical protein U5E37_003859 [Yersinia enterocolitica]|nr:hypothetical protein [Yersinia enterocolitica]
MNNIEELKSKKPENLKSRSSVSADYVTDDNTGGYFVVECGNCGEVFPSQKLDGGGAIADSGDYGDAYCPHCNETDPDECANVGLVWNVQQAKINALIAQLEAAQKERDALREVHIGAGSNTRAAADIYFQLIEELQVPAGGSLVGVIDNLKAALSAANEKLKGGQVPVDSDSFSLTEAACEQWKLVSIEANKKVAALGDENRKLRTEIAKIKGSNMPVGVVDGWLKERDKPFKYKVASTQELEDGTELFTSPQKPVVLPERYSFEVCATPDPNGEWVDVNDVIEAIKAAGFTVEE